MTRTLLSVRGVSKNFGDVEALKTITLDLHKGDIVGLVGGNGAGKTTLLRLLCGLYKPSDGHVVFVDDGGIEHPIHKVRSNLGVVPESTGLYARLTAWENIRYHSRLNNIDDKQAWNRTLRLAKALEMEGDLQRQTRGFSRGMRQKTALLRALSHDPDILLLDEPTGGLDVTSARRVRELVRKLGDEGRTVIYSTHQLNEAQQVCDRIVIIHNGTLRADGSPTKLMEDTGTDSLEDAFVELTQDESREVETPEPASKFQQFWSRLTAGRKQPPSTKSPQNGGE
ncbi:MAG TPA: ABC transporter ATP-binding protein [Candidatus Poseidoniales archaeon]|nr:ABC transporter ATP-binding protein [Candidatus Poseidoniales archaeon]